jgi:hypothetical protein
MIIGYSSADVKLIIRLGSRQKMTTSRKRLKPPLRGGFGTVSTHGRSVIRIIVQVGAEFKR